MEFFVVVLRAFVLYNFQYQATRLAGKNVLNMTYFFYFESNVKL